MGCWSINVSDKETIFSGYLAIVLLFSFVLADSMLLTCKSNSIHCILQKSDNSWKKSTTHYIVTSYLRPLLLWTGAILICRFHYYKIITLSDDEWVISFSDYSRAKLFANCRAFEPVILPTETSQVVKERLLSFVKSLSTVVAFAYCLSRCAYFLISFRISLEIVESFGHLVVSTTCS
jgi:hypothetical protein